MSSANPMPGADRVVLRTVNGHQFGMRRPSRADNGEIWRRYVHRIASPLLAESDILTTYDGTNVLWESRFQVLLLPRVSRRGEEISFGESAPAHWLEMLRDEKGNVTGRQLSFENVMPEEFAEVCDSFTDIFEAGGKKSSPPESSISSAVGQSSG